MTKQGVMTHQGASHRTGGDDRSGDGYKTGGDDTAGEGHSRGPQRGGGG